MIELIEKAKILSEALPYFKEFFGKNIVIKYGGSTMIDENLREVIARDIILLKYVGINPIVVHGGGKHITSMLNRLGKETEFLDGQRVTDAETVGIAEMVLTGQLNKNIVALIHKQGASAVGLSGKDGKLIEVRKKEVKDKDYGFVGEIVNVNVKIINVLEENGFIPIISPIGINSAGETFNINADAVAYAIASELKASKLIFLTDVKGVYKDINDEKSIISSLTDKSIKKYISEGIISGGMLPKLEMAIDTLEKGVKKIHIINGKIEHSILLEVFTKGGIGTEIVLEED
jgi:acetylglutamate kinase